MMESSAFYDHPCSHITLVDPARHFYAVLAGVSVPCWCIPTQHFYAASRCQRNTCGLNQWGLWARWVTEWVMGPPRYGQHIIDPWAKPHHSGESIIGSRTRVDNWTENIIDSPGGIDNSAESIIGFCLGPDNHSIIIINFGRHFGSRLGTPFSIIIINFRL